MTQGDRGPLKPPWLRPEERRLALFAICVRLAVLIATTALDSLLPDYDTSKFITPGTASASYRLTEMPYTAAALDGAMPLPHGTAGGAGGSLSAASESGAAAERAHLHGWLVWDSVFFADIAARGYVYEQYYAFFPLLPALASWAPRCLFPVLALAVNAAASVTGTVLLYRLGERLTVDRQLAALACLFFVLNPATIFHAAPYTEATFMMATLAALYWLHCRGCLLPAVAAVAVSCGLRSNGVINAGYLGHYCLSRAVAAWPSGKIRALGLALQGVAAAAAAVLPLISFQHAAYETFCRTHGRLVAKHALPPTGTADSTGAERAWPRPWCSSRVPYVYGFVQAQYWGVGFLRYWTLQQLPNFLLAAPVLLLSAGGLIEYCKANGRHVALLGLPPLTHPKPQPPREDEAPGSSTGGGSSTRGVAVDDTRGRWQGKGLRRRHATQGAKVDGGVGSAGGTRSDDFGDGGVGGCDAGGGSPCNHGGGVGVGGDTGDLSGYLRPELAVFMYPWAFSVAVAATTMHVQVATRFLLSSCPPLYWYMAHVWLRVDRRQRDQGRQGDAGQDGGAAGRRSGEGSGGCRREATGGSSDGRCGGGSREVDVVWASAEGEGRGSIVGRGGRCGGESSWWVDWCGVGLWRWCWLYMALGCVLFINFLPWT